jgi:steroid 5-alpha reductase family enzyme
MALHPMEGNTAIVALGILVILAGTIGETVADWQLKQFKRQPPPKEVVCRVGLWNYSRHPNYFFEFVVWLGIFTVGVSFPYGWLGVIALAIILYTLFKVTGIPTIENHALQSKGAAYQAYREEVSVFVPWFPRKKARQDTQGKGEAP